MTTSEQLLVSIPEACNQLGGISRTTVYQLVNHGDLVKVNIGSRGFITGQSLHDYVQSLTMAAK
jgi:predicted DNA-binding transcriptional regulator AlpA